ncbi:zinc finger protein 830 [Dioscorea alata]|nr:zinc finger protein 830 [Dioscorea alata]
MDAKAQKKALYRAKLKESSQKREKRIDSPLVRYNENDQAVCRVCNVIVKSELFWPAHEASRKHHEAIDIFKATAAGVNRAKSTNIEPPVEKHNARASSTLPADFFDNQQTKKQKKDEGKPVDDGSKEGLPAVHVAQVPESGKNSSKVSNHLTGTNKQGGLPENFFDSKGGSYDLVSDNVVHTQIKQAKKSLPVDFFESTGRSDADHSNQLIESSKSVGSGAESKQVIGVLPEGFFDNKDADLRARGIEPVKVDIDDAYKEFEKEIQDNLQEVDDRLEEEEIDAADVREEIESLEQQAYREQIEKVKIQVLRAKAAHSAREQERPALAMDQKDSSDDSSSEGDDDVDDEDDGNFSVDWRAQHL